MMPQIIPVDAGSDILAAYTGTPVEWCCVTTTCSEALPSSSGRAELLVGMCMDTRKDLVIPNEFAFVIPPRAATFATTRCDISYAVAIGA